MLAAKHSSGCACLCPPSTARPALHSVTGCSHPRRCLSLVSSSRVSSFGTPVLPAGSQSATEIDAAILQRRTGHRLAAIDTDDKLEASSVKPAGTEILDQDSDTAKKEAEIDKLRAAEKFMKVGSKNAVCNSCQYEYEAKKGDPEYPVGPNTNFTELPKDWQCPVCGAEKNTFRSQSKTIAGFASNQQYGFGGNGLTAGQKSLAIYGSLLAFFGLFIAGYFVQ